MKKIRYSIVATAVIIRFAMYLCVIYLWNFVCRVHHELNWWAMMIYVYFLWCYNVDTVRQWKCLLVENNVPLIMQRKYSGFRGNGYALKQGIISQDLDLTLTELSDSTPQVNSNGKSAPELTRCREVKVRERTYHWNIFHVTMLMTITLWYNYFMKIVILMMHHVGKRSQRANTPSWLETENRLLDDGFEYPP